MMMVTRTDKEQWPGQMLWNQHMTEDHFDDVMNELNWAIMFEWSEDDIRQYCQAEAEVCELRGNFNWTEEPLPDDILAMLPVAARSAYARVRAWLAGEGCVCDHNPFPGCFCEDIVKPTIKAINWFCCFIDEVLVYRRCNLRLAKLPDDHRMRSWLPQEDQVRKVTAPMHRAYRLFVALDELGWSRETNYPDGVRASLWRASINSFLAGAEGLLPPAAENYWEVARHSIDHVLEIHAHDPKPPHPVLWLPRYKQWTIAKARNGYAVPSELRLSGPKRPDESWDEIEPLQASLEDLLRAYITFLFPYSREYSIAYYLRHCVYSVSTPLPEYVRDATQ